MKEILIYPIGRTDACYAAAEHLRRCFPIADHPSPDVTHVLSDIPGAPDEAICRMLPDDIVRIGGNMPAQNRKAIDLLKDEDYLWRNAAITAECALQVASQKLPLTFRDCRILIIGWGRIGRHLTHLLASCGADITVCSRSAVHRAEIRSCGFAAAEPGSFHVFDLVFNTAPGVLCEVTGGVQIELASQPGLTGKDVISARGLPGKLAPESSGRLIADTIRRYWKEGKL